MLPFTRIQVNTTYRYIIIMDKNEDPLEGKSGASSRTNSNSLLSQGDGCYGKRPQGSTHFFDLRLGSGFRVPSSSSGLRAPDSRLRALGSRLRAQGSGFRTPGSGFRTPGKSLIKEVLPMNFYFFDFSEKHPAPRWTDNQTFLKLGLIKYTLVRFNR